MIYLNNNLLKIVFPDNPNITEFYEPLQTFMGQHGILDNQQRACHFLSQIGHESGDCRYLSENLNYSAKRLMEVFPKYFTSQSAVLAANNPRAIASIVYANRMGNGDINSHDGWNFRGRGLIQITGRENYKRCSDGMDININLLPTHLETVVGSVQCAVWYWTNRKLNMAADRDDIAAITRAINGGFTGLADRKIRYQRAYNAITQQLQQKLESKNDNTKVK